MKGYDKCHSEILTLGPGHSFDLPILLKRKSSVCLAQPVFSQPTPHLLRVQSSAPHLCKKLARGCC